MAIGQAQAQACLGALAFLLLDVPLALLAPAEADRAVGHHDLAAGLVIGQRLPVRVVGFAQPAQFTGTQETARHQAAIVAAFQAHQHRHVRVLAAVVLEVLRGRIDVELAQDHMAEGEGQCRVGALLGVQPMVGQLGQLGIVRADRHRLGAVVARLGEEVRIGRARLRHVRAPGDDVAAVVPVGRFGHVGLLAPDLRRGRRQVAVPVIEGQAGAAQQRQVARAGGVGHHRHRRNRREADHAVRAVLLHRVQVGGGDDLVGLFPLQAHEAAHAAAGLVRARLLLVLHDAGPGVDRALALARFAPQAQQRAADQRVLQPVGAVQVPGIAGATRAATRFMVGQVRARAWVVGLLGFPGDQPVLDIDLPAARTGAVHAVGGTHDLVVLPAGAVTVFPVTAFALGESVAIGKGLGVTLEELQAIEEITHRGSPFADIGIVAVCVIWLRCVFMSSAGCLGTAPVVPPPGHGQAGDVENNESVQRHVGAAGQGDG